MQPCAAREQLACARGCARSMDRLAAVRKVLPSWRSPVVRAFVHGLTVITFLYLCAGELLPLPVRQASPQLHKNWPVQQVWLLAALSCLAVLLGWSGGGCIPSDRWLLPSLNIIPVVAVLVATRWSAVSSNCVGEYAVEEGCDYVAVLLDVVGVITARLPRPRPHLALRRQGARWSRSHRRGSDTRRQCRCIAALGGGAQGSRPSTRSPTCSSTCASPAWPASGSTACLRLWRTAQDQQPRAGQRPGTARLPRAAPARRARVAPAAPPLLHRLPAQPHPGRALFVVCCALHDLPCSSSPCGVARTRTRTRASQAEAGRSRALTLTPSCSPANPNPGLA